MRDKASNVIEFPRRDEAAEAMDREEAEKLAMLADIAIDAIVYHEPKGEQISQALNAALGHVLLIGCKTVEDAEEAAEYMAEQLKAYVCDEGNRKKARKELERRAREAEEMKIIEENYQKVARNFEIPANYELPDAEYLS